MRDLFFGCSLALCLISTAMLTGCGDDSGTDGSTTANAGGGDGSGGSGGTTGSEACTADNALCLGLNVPADYAGTPDRVFVGLYGALPPAGPPDVMVGTVDAPPIEAGTTLDVQFEDVNASGDLYLYVVLYDENGGQFMPEPGMDYVAESATPYTFDGGAVNVEALDLALAE